MTKLYPVWLEQLQQLRSNCQIGVAVASSGTSQHPDIRHIPAVHHVAVPTLVANSDSSRVSSGSLAMPFNERGSLEHAVTFGQSDHQAPSVHTPQHSDISLVSSSSGE